MEVELTAQENGDLEQYQLARQYAQQILVGVQGLKNMQNRWNALDSGTNMIAGQGVFNGLTKDDVGAAVFATADAILALLGTGHGTNLAKVA